VTNTLPKVVGTNYLVARYSLEHNATISVVLVFGTDSIYRYVTRSLKYNVDSRDSRRLRIRTRYPETSSFLSDLLEDDDDYDDV
jgi:hypothetical protein